MQGNDFHTWTRYHKKHSSIPSKITNDNITNYNTTNDNITNYNITNDNITNDNITNDNIINDNTTNDNITNDNNLNHAIKLVYMKLSDPSTFDLIQPYNMFIIM